MLDTVQEKPRTRVKERVKPATYADRVPKSLPRPTRHRVRPDLYDENGRRRVLREYTEYHTSRRRLTPAEQKTMLSDLSQKVEQAAKWQPLLRRCKNPAKHNIANVTNKISIPRRHPEIAVLILISSQEI